MYEWYRKGIVLKENVITIYFDVDKAYDTVDY